MEMFETCEKRESFHIYDIADVFDNELLNLTYDIKSENH